MDSLVLQVLLLEGLLHLEIGLSFALDSLLFVIANNTSVHSLHKNVRSCIMWRETSLTALSCFCEKCTNATVPIATAQVVARVIWDARDILTVSCCDSKKVVAESCGQFESRWKLWPTKVDLPPSSRPQLHHRPLRNDDRDIEQRPHSSDTFKMVRGRDLHESARC
jgi:hypothetical protein